MKLDRLISILVLLLRKERVQARELADKFGVSVRTILRDVDALNLAGIPIVTYQGINGGIGIAEGYRIDRSILTENEMAAIITTLRGIGKGLHDNSHEILMEKFKNTMSASQLDKINSKANQLVIDITPWTINERIQQKLSSIRRAIEDRKEISFEYSDSMSNRTSRNVEPYSLVLKAQKWYLYAWCHVREDFRFFKLSRIKNLTVTNKAFIPKKISMEEQPWEKEWQNPVKTVTLDLIFEKEFETIAEEWFGEDVITNENGSITVSVTLPENNWLYGFLLSFGPGVEVISPLHIRENLRKFAQEIVEKYSK